MMALLLALQVAMTLRAAGAAPTLPDDASERRMFVPAGGGAGKARRWVPTLGNRSGLLGTCLPCCEEPAPGQACNL